MSKWKALSHSDGKFTVNKFNEWAPSHPFTIPYQGPKIKYSEGDEITDITSPVFNIEFTGVPISNNHTPCGYWSKDYIPPQTTIYTSLLYPVEVVDNLVTSIISPLNGEFRSITVSYNIPIESITTYNINITSGIFKSIYNQYSYIDNITTTTINISIGIFKQSLFTYTIPIEYLNSSNVNLVSGIFRDILISYTYWLPENLETSNINIVSGNHAN